MIDLLKTIDELENIGYFGFGIFYLGELKIGFDWFKVGKLEDE
mgnify:CR=1 FL=1